MCKHILTGFLCLLGLTASAQLSELEAGKLYTFSNRTSSGTYMSARNSGEAGTASVGSGNAGKAEMWYVADVREDGDGVKTYRLRNYAFGTYLRGASHNSAWTLVGPETAGRDYFYLVTLGGTYNSMSLSAAATANDKMHMQGGTGTIVTWNAGSEASMWTVTAVDGISAEEIEQTWSQIDELNSGITNVSAIEAHLDAMFTSKSCTQLRPEYVAKDEEALCADAHFTGIPSTLQSMTLKIWRTANGTDVDTAWAENNYDPAKPAWDGGYARRYRVQKYEPYTDRSLVASGFRTNVHSNFNNPTGIFANTHQALYVMVEGEIKEGATLYLDSFTGHSQDRDATTGTRLHEGLNIIPFYKDLEWTQVYYAVQSLKEWDGTTNKAYRLSDFPDLTIHIEGGNVNGYYNAVGDDLYAHGRSGANVYPQGDDETDWDYLAARNNLTDLTILGKYMTFQFYFAPTYDNDGNLHNTTDHFFTLKSDGTRLARLPDIIERWDRIVLSERLIMGVTTPEEIDEANSKYPTLDDPSRGVFAWTGGDADYGCDYSDHYRQHYLAWGMPSGYMSGGWVASNYHINTFDSILRAILTDSGSSWGPGHEIGHQNQGPINMRGLTETSNNLFANVALWYGGLSTSRVNGNDGTLEEVLRAYYQENSDFFTNNIWAQTHMYYKLWLYYHLVGHNNKFYPRLYEYLRRNPMVIKYDQSDPAGEVSGSTPLLHFYRAACIAAGEDLTEFFTAYGFFTPMDHRLVGDYSSAEYTQTQAQIDAVKAEVAAMNLPKNENILFINDATSQVTYGHDGVTPRVIYSGVKADMGGYQEAFINSTTATGSFDASVGDNVTITGGAGAVGVKIYSADGKLLAFSDKYTFPVSQEVREALASGQAAISAYSSDGSAVEIPYDVTATARELLSDYVNTVRAAIGAVDDGGESGSDYTIVNAYKADAVAGILDLLSQCEASLSEGKDYLYAGQYDALKTAYKVLLENEDAKVSYVPGAKLLFVNKLYPTRYMADSEEASVLQTQVFTEEQLAAGLDDNAKWTLEAAPAISNTSAVYMRNVGTGKYVGTVTRGNTDTPMVESTGAKASLTYNERTAGYFSFSYNNLSNRSLHCAAAHAYKVVGWDPAADASQWMLKMVDIPQDSQAVMNLRDILNRTTALVDSVVYVGYPGRLALSEANVTSNATEPGRDIRYLFGEHTGENEYFHTEWRAASAPDEDHYLLIDCGEGYELETFTLTYGTRKFNAGVDAPRTIVVEGSNDNTEFTEISTLTGLPTAGFATYESDVLGTAGVPYRYVRLRVTDGAGRVNGHYYFGMASLSVSRAEPALKTRNEAYAAACAEQGIDFSQVIAEIMNANGLLAAEAASVDDMNASATALTGHYEAILAAIDGVVNGDLNAARSDLRSAIGELQEIFDTVAADEHAAVPLQSVDSAATGFLYCNAPYTASLNADYSQPGTDGYHLLDGNPATYLHTAYGGDAPDEDHYLRVYVGEEGVTRFDFNYINRNAGTGHIKTLVVEGADEADGQYEVIKTLENLPVAAGARFESATLSHYPSFKYIRFRVTANSGDKSYNGHRWFHLAEFRMNRTDLKLIPENSGMLTFDEYTEAVKTGDMAALKLDHSASVAELAENAAAVRQQAELLRSRIALVSDRTALAELIAATRELIATDCSESLNPVSADVLAAAEAAVAEAQTIYGREELTTDDYKSALEALGAAKSALEEEVAYAMLPVRLTTDVTAPAVHVLTVSRANAGGPVEYRGSDSYTIKLNNSGRQVPNDCQLWYVVKGENAPAVRMVNLADGNRVLSIKKGNMDAGSDRVHMLPLDSDETQCNQWIITDKDSNEGWYNVRTTGDNALMLANYGSRDNNLGLFRQPAHEVSNFRFEAKSDTWLRLYNAVKNAKEPLSAPDYAFPSDKIHETEVGFYTPAVVNPYVTAYGNAHQALVATPSPDDDTLDSLHSEFVAANDNLQPTTISTGVVEVNAAEGEETVIHDLQGRRVSRPHNGVYIINGRKVYVK